MKKITKILIIAMLGISIIACGKEDDDNSNANNNQGNNNNTEINKPNENEGTIEELSKIIFDESSKLWYEIDSEKITAKVIKPQENSLQKVNSVYTGDIIVPDFIIIEKTEYKVVGISNESFANSLVESIVLGKNIEEVGNDAFKDCEKLKNLTIKNENTIIDLSKISITITINIIVPDKLKEEYTNANPELLINIDEKETIDYICEQFAYTQTNVEKTGERLVISYSNGEEYELDLTQNRLFTNGSKLKNIIIPKYVIHDGKKLPITDICIASFEDIYISSLVSKVTIHRIKNIYIDRRNPNFILKDGVLFSKDQKTLIKHPDISEVNIPQSVTIIGEDAFSFCTNLTSINIPESVTIIGDDAFYECKNLATINIPQSVTIIGNDAFDWCENLETINIPESVTNIGYGAFRGCKKLTSIKIPESVTSIGSYTFSQCENLTSVELPKNIKFIPNSLFQGCVNLKSILLPEGITSIGDFAFNWCIQLTSMEIPESVTTIGQCAFIGCSELKSITLPQNLASISNATFSGCTSLTSITIPQNVTSISTSAFSNCSNLSSIILPARLKSIDEGAFAGCDNLKEITIKATYSVAKSYLVEIPRNATLYVKESEYETFNARCGDMYDIKILDEKLSIDKNKIDAACQAFAQTQINIEEEDEKLKVYYNDGTIYSFTKEETSVTLCGFDQNSNSGELIIPKYITYKGEILPVKSIDTWVFTSNRKITSIYLPESITSIGQNNFSYCDNLTTINIPQEVTFIDEMAFKFNGNLTSITIKPSYSIVKDFIQYFPDGATLYVTEKDYNTYVASWNDKFTIKKIGEE